MAEEIEDSDFYREDFSTESEWEIFVAQLREICQKWELSDKNWGSAFAKDELFNCKWEVKSDYLELLNKEITVTYYMAKLQSDDDVIEHEILEEKEPYHHDLMSTINTFSATPLAKTAASIHPLARSYGLRRFIVIHPSNMSTQYLSKPAEFSFFLSAANVVAAEICSAVPIFVQIYHLKWNYYIGVGVGATMRTNFNMIALEQTPEHCRYLTGLLAMFKEKIRATYVRPATVSVQNAYSLDTIKLRIPMYVPFSNSFIKEDSETENGSEIQQISTTQYITLPHGYNPKSCTQMFPIYTWPTIAENIALDSAMSSVFVPSKAPLGCINYIVKADSYLNACLNVYQLLRKSTSTLESYVGHNFSGISSAAEMANPLDKLTNPGITYLRQARHQRQKSAEKLKEIAGPMKSNELHQMMCYLFPDLNPEEALFPYRKNSKKEDFVPFRIKSAEPDSLVCRVSSLLATVNAHFGSERGLAQLWASFTRELRYSWDNCILVQGVAGGFPDTRTCLLHQKLQMLNVCIERSAARRFGTNAATMTTTENESSDEAADDDDEFYDCNAEEPTTSTKLLMAPEGRLRSLDKLKLLDSDELLYVPITQEPVPKTEDQLQDDADVMLKLGPGSGLTTQMMCSSLLSDMEAFKAANPKAKMEDFIRWYSPKDWEESENENGELEGKLSPRMQAPDNTWQVVWKQAHPIPTSRQKRLFDDTNEALKVLHYLETRDIREIYELTVFSLMHTAILKVKDILDCSNVLDLFNAQIEELLSDLCRLSRDNYVTEETEDTTLARLPNPEPIIQKITALENQYYQYKCVEHVCGYPAGIKLDKIKRIFEDILKNDGYCSIIKNYATTTNKDGHIEDSTNVLSNILDNKNELRDNLISKEYVLRVDGETANHTKGQTTGPQFLRAIITGDQLRLCGAFTESTTFL